MISSPNCTWYVYHSIPDELFFCMYSGTTYQELITTIMNDFYLIEFIVYRRVHNTKCGYTNIIVITKNYINTHTHKYFHVWCHFYFPVRKQCRPRAVLSLSRDGHWHVFIREMEYTIIIITYFVPRDIPLSTLYGS